MQSANLVGIQGFATPSYRDWFLKQTWGITILMLPGAVITLQMHKPLLNSTPTSVLNNNYIKTYIAEPQLNYTYSLVKQVAGINWRQLAETQPFNPIF